MKRMVAVTAVLVMFGLSAWASPNQNLSGWISDSKCGAKGANAAHASCAKKCVEGGEKPVLVTDKDQKIESLGESVYQSLVAPSGQSLANFVRDSFAVPVDRQRFDCIASRLRARIFH